MSQQKDSKPVKSFSSGTIEVSIWRQEVDKDERTRYSIKIQKQYKNDKGE